MNIIEISDREDIKTVIFKYCHGIDRRDPHLLRTVYWPEAIEDHGLSHSGVEEFIGMAMAIVAACVVTHHQVGNILIHLEAEAARVESYVHTYHRIEGPTQPHWRVAPDPIAEDQRGKFANYFGGARFIDRMEKRGGIWRIIHRSVIHDWYRIVDSQDGNRFPYPGYEQFHLGSHRSRDLGHQLFVDVEWR